MKKLNLKSVLSLIKSKWQELIAILSLIAMALFFVLKFGGVESANLPLILLIIVGGTPLLLQIIFKMFKGDLGADLLALIALVVAVYLEQYLAGSLIVLMLSSGQALENYASRRASFALEALAGRMPAVAHRQNGDLIIDIPISEIQIGDLLVIYPHETCPVDGLVVSGRSKMDESYLTGEPYMLSKTAGSNVLSGAVNGEGALTIRVEKLPQDSRYASIIKVMEEAENNRPQMRRIADKIGAIFAPFSLIFAIAVYYFTGSAENFLAVLVVATPCPLLIAVPISIISAISIAAKNSIIIRDPIVLEKLAICKTAIFDKTGTLTYGEPELTEIVTLGKFSEKEILQMTASLEIYSRHPLAAAIVNAAKKENLSLLPVVDLSEKPGQGLTGHISDKEIFVTSRKKIEDNIACLLPSFSRGLECVVMVNSQLAALLHFRDAPRSDSHHFINHLGPSHNFTKVMLVSGDRDSEVDYLASLLGIENYYSGKTPQEKLEIVRAENKIAPTFFMGDGINDAPALTAATVGIAFGQHSAVTSEAAGAVIMENSLAKVDELVHISEKLRSIALQSAIGGMVFSVGGMILAAFGMITPVQGALLQEVIDVVAILNALRLTWGKVVDSDLK